MSYMNVLFFDPEIRVKEKYSIFLNIGINKADWVPIYIPQFDATHNPSEWVDSTFSKIDNADAIICFGNYLIFEQLGDWSKRLIDSLTDKARCGTPFLLHMNRLAEHITNSSGTHPVIQKGREGILQLFKAFEVEPTDIKIDLSLTHVENNWSPSVGYFNKSDDTLRDPYLFKGVTKVLVSQPNLINYSGEVFPIIDVSEAVSNFVDSRDFFTDSLQGIRPAIGVIRQPDDEYQLILSGSYFANPSKIFAGPVKGIEENMRFAENVILALTGAAKISINIQQKCYDLFNHLERSLGNLVIQVLPENKLYQWVNPNTRAKLTDKNGKFHYEDSNFGNLCYMVFDNWTIFRDYFPGYRIRELKDILLSVATGTRRLLAHPHKAEQLNIQFTKKDAERLESALKVVQVALNRKGN